MTIKNVALSAALITIASTAYAQDTTPQFVFPVSCTYGEDCWTVKYVDVDPSEGIKDFNCKAKSSDGHKGVDFGLGSITQMREGVDVLAAAGGKVLRIRDGESDSVKDKAALQAIKESRKECGNGVLIDHGDGLQTIYCHLKEDSIVVEPKQKIKAGQKIAQVGHSGLAEFPHLHFGVTWEGGIVDPYTGALNSEGCGAEKKPLWHMGLPMDYEPVAIFNGGFRNQPPNFKAIENGSSENPLTLPFNSAAFVFWAGMYNVEAGDKVTLTIKDPEGETFVRSENEVDQTRMRQYYYTGRKIGTVQLKAGEYTGHITLERAAEDGQKPIIREEEYSVTVEP